jgi:alkylation response protein AidB-like acyl-CoA dehydrogenase
VDAVRLKGRDFIDTVVRPVEQTSADFDREAWVKAIIGLRKKAKEWDAAYKIEHELDFTAEVSMAKHFVANSLWRIIDRAIQVHGALGYSTDTPLADMLKQARWARFADGADEIHQMRIA